MSVLLWQVSWGDRNGSEAEMKKACEMCHVVCVGWVPDSQCLPSGSVLPHQQTEGTEADFGFPLCDLRLPDSSPQSARPSTLGPSGQFATLYRCPPHTHTHTCTGESRDRLLGSLWPRFLPYQGKANPLKYASYSSHITIPMS